MRVHVTTTEIRVPQICSRIWLPDPEEGLYRVTTGCSR